MGFFLDGEVFYKKSKNQTLLRCVDASEAKKIVHKIHEGVCVHMLVGTRWQDR